MTSPDFEELARRVAKLRGVYTRAFYAAQGAQDDAAKDRCAARVEAVQAVLAEIADIRSKGVEP